MSHLTGRQILLVLAGAFALTALAVGIYGLVRGPAGPTRVTAMTTTPAHDKVVAGRANAGEQASIPDPTDHSLPHTADPIAYAQAVATSLFDWDTSTGFLPSDYTAPVLADSDPSGEETPGLLADVATYVPTLAQWLDLGAMDVEQSLAIDEAYVPESWSAAESQAHGQLRPGTTAVTITGSRHRSGVWGDEPAASSTPVSFTVFVACAPSFNRCHVLRLSQLDDPLR